MSETALTTKDLVLQLDTKVDRLIDEMSAIKIVAHTVGGNVGSINDHEVRLRALEQFKNAVPTAAALGLLVGSSSLALTLLR